MKPVSSDLSTYLDNTTAGWWVDLYKFTPKTVSDIYITTHTDSIGSYMPGGSNGRPLIKFVSRRQQAGLDPGEMRIRLLGGAEATWGGVRLPLAAINGAFDGMWVRVERMFGSVPGTPDVANGTMPLHEGPISEIVPFSTGVELSISDGREDLTSLFPKRIVQPGCGWAFGSSECGISLASHTFNYTAGSSSTITRVNSSSFTAKAASYFEHGLITFTGNVTSSLAGVSRGVAVHNATTGYVDLDRPLLIAPASGDTFSISAGCPKTLAACGHNGVNGKFGIVNSDNFGGFPFIPSPDSVAT